MLTPYPPFSLEAAAIVGKAARLIATGNTEQVDKSQTIHAAYELLGAGLGAWAPDGPVISGTAGTTDFVAAADCCDELTVKRGPTEPTKAIPWAVLVPVVLELLRMFLKK